MKRFPQSTGPFMWSLHLLLIRAWIFFPKLKDNLSLMHVSQLSSWVRGSDVMTTKGKSLAYPELFIVWIYWLKASYSGHATDAVWMVQTEKNSLLDYRVGELISLVLTLLGMVDTFVIVCYHRGFTKKKEQIPACTIKQFPVVQPQPIKRWSIAFVTAASLGPLIWSLVKLFVKAVHLTIVRRKELQIQLSNDDRSIHDALFHLRNLGSSESSDPLWGLSNIFCPRLC